MSEPGQPGWNQQGKGPSRKATNGWHWIAWCLLVGGAAGTAGACTVKGEPQSFSGGLGGGRGTTDLPSGAGIGEDCEGDDDCRDGLACSDDGTCEPGGTLAEGDRCLIAPECESGLSCNTACEDNPLALCCGPVGEGAAGDACESDLDCGEHLRCGFAGLSLACVPAGEGDLGSDCSNQSECYQGLYCSSGECSLPVPPLGFAPWEGVSCPEIQEDNIEALFKVPSADGTPEDADFFSLPFPSDIRLKDGHPDLDDFPSPGSELLGVDLVARYAQAVSASADHWGPNPSVIFRFSGLVNTDTLKTDDDTRRVEFVDLEGPEGSQLGLTWRTHSARTSYVCDNWLAVGTPLGGTLTPEHTHAVWITTDLEDADGNKVARDPQFDAMMKDSAPSDPALATAHERYAPLRDYLDANAIARDTILVAALFTVGDPIKSMRGLAQAVSNADTPTASGWVRCATDVESPCPQSDAKRGCQEAADDYDEYHALLSLPVFQQGTAPYLDEGGAIGSDVVRTEDVCISLTVPKASMPTSGWPIVVFGHGTGGSFRSHVRQEVAGVLATSGTAVLGFDQVQHGPRRGDSTEDPETLFFNFPNPDASQGNPMQGAADLLAIERWLQGLTLTAEESGGEALSVDASAVALFGHSQGATHASLALPFANSLGAVLSGNGGDLRESLLGKTQPVDIASGIALALQDADTSGQLRMGELHPALALLQQHIDPADPMNFAALLSSRPEAAGEKHVLQTFGLDDSYAPPRTLRAYIYAADSMAVATPPSGVEASGDNDLGLTTADAISLNAGTDPGVTLGTRQYTSSNDGHFVVFDSPDANADAIGFLENLVASEAPIVPAP